MPGYPDWKIALVHPISQERVDRPWSRKDLVPRLYKYYCIHHLDRALQVKPSQWNDFGCKVERPY